MSSDHYRPLSAPEIAPYTRRSLWIKVDHHCATARELVRDGEADRDGGLSGTTLL
jgi:hypothetical protein